jgi:biotin carboxyl carrier protein
MEVGRTSDIRPRRRIEVVKRFTLLVDGQKYEMEWHGDRVLVDGRPFAIQFSEKGAVAVDGRRYTVELAEGRAVVDGVTHAVGANGLNQKLNGNSRASARGSAAPAPQGAGTVMAVMPGKVVRVMVCQGQQVAADHVVCVLEAMKMQNEIRAGKSGTVTKVCVAPGEDVEMGKALVVIS